MTTHWHQVLRLIYIAMSFLFLRTAFSQGAVEPLLSEFRAENQHLVLRAILPKGNVPWRDFVVVLQATNSGNQNIRCIRFLGCKWGGFRLSMRNWKNDNVTLTPLGEQQLVEKWVYGSELFNDFAPGMHEETRFRLSDYFNVDKPGKYKLSVIWCQDPEAKNGGERAVKLEEIAVSVEGLR